MNRINQEGKTVRTIKCVVGKSHNNQKKGCIKKMRQEFEVEESAMRLLENLSRFDEDVAEFQMINQRVHGSFKRRLKNQICFGQRRLRAWQ